MSWSLISHSSAHTAAGGSSPAQTGGISTIGAGLIIVPATWYSQETAPTISDSQGNTWSPLTAVSAGSESSTQLFYCAGPSTSGSHTFKADNGGILFGTVGAAAFSGSAVSPFDVQDTNSSGAATTSITTSPGSSITPGQDNSLIVTAVNPDAFTSGLAIDTGFTIIETIVPSGGNYQGLGFAYLIQNTAAAIDATWSWTGSCIPTTAIAAFKPGPAGLLVPYTPWAQLGPLLAH